MTSTSAGDLGSSEYLTHLDRESRRFGEIMAKADPGAPVPSCPDWTAEDLLWHLTKVQWFWGSIAAGPITDDAAIEAADEDTPPQPEAYPDLLDLFATVRQRLCAAVADGSDDSPLWSWAADQTLGFTRRRQAHEALIHRVDAEQTAGVQAQSLDPRLAADGIDEIVTVMWAELPDWASFSPAGGIVSLEASDTGAAWLLELGRMIGTSTRTGKIYDEPTVAVREPGSGTPQAAIRGTAEDLDRWLWSRASGGINSSGSEDVLTALAAVRSAGVQ